MLFGIPHENQRVVFQPGALFRLTCIPSQELTKTFVDAEAIWATAIRLVSERLNSTDALPVGPGLGRINFGFTDFNTAVMVAFALCDIFLVGLIAYDYAKGKNYGPYLVATLIWVLFHSAFPWVPNSVGWQLLARGFVQLFF